jgi:hypothetical protein
MENWRHTWRCGIAPELSRSGLEALRMALLQDDPRLSQEGTLVPITAPRDWPVEGADAIAYAGWRGEHLPDRNQVEAYWADICYRVDRHFGQPAACRWFLNFWDTTPRDELFRAMLPEVELALTGRMPQCVEAPLSA